MQTTGQAASTGGAAATAPQKEALYLRWHCASRRNALPVDRALDRALDRASESESLVLDARSGIGGQDPTHDAPAARRVARRRTTGGSAWLNAWPAWGSMEQRGEA